MRRHHLVPVSLALLTLAAIPGTASAQDDKPKIKRRLNVITAAEIAERSDVQTALDAVRRLRSAWLRTRDIGTPSRPVPAPIVVYVDGIRMGGVEALEQLQASMVQEMEKLSASDATTRYGTDHTSGAILVTTIRRKPDGQP